MKKKVVDIGNGYTKYMIGEENPIYKKFATKVSLATVEDINALGDAVHKVKFDNKDYYVGVGSQILGQNRYYTKEYLICLLTAIALSEPSKSEISAEVENIEVVLGIGVPVGIHEFHSEKLKPYLEDLGPQEIIVNDRKFVITISKALVIPEGGLGNVMAEVRTGHNVVFDIGSGTYDEVEWIDGKMVNIYTSPSACNEFYKDSVRFVQKTKGNCFIKEEQIQRVVETKVYTKTIDETLIQNSIKRFVENMFDSVSIDKEIPLDNVYLIGGGAYMSSENVESYLIEHFPGAKMILIEYAEYANLIIYNRTLTWIWKRDNGGE